MGTMIAGTVGACAEANLTLCAPPTALLTLRVNKPEQNDSLWQGALV